MRSTDTLMVLTGAHPVHVGFAETIGADRHRLNYNPATKVTPQSTWDFMRDSFSIPKGYRYVLTESCPSYPAMRRKLGGFDSKIINLNASQLLYLMAECYFTSFKKSILDRLLPEVDAYLVLGEYGESLLKRTFPDKPYRIVYPYVQKGLYDKLLQVTPQRCGVSITTVVSIHPHYKGLDILVDALSLLRVPVTLNIIGKADVSSVVNSAAPNVKVNVLGHVPDISPVLSRTDLFVSMGRGDSFCVAVLEAMLAGVPSIISDQTGTKEVVRKVDERLVCPLDPAELSRRIERFFSLEEPQRLRLSESSRENALPFNEDAMLALFRKEYASLCEEIS
jgi:glycosyltransferase involved in cell wall biosynthesis